MLTKEISIELNAQVNLIIEKNEVYLEHFDFLLVIFYNQLKKEFEKFKKKPEFKDLKEFFNFNCETQNALITVGLINRDQ